MDKAAVILIPHGYIYLFLMRHCFWRKINSSVDSRRGWYKLWRYLVWDVYFQICTPLLAETLGVYKYV